jgi:hypothetical protein
MTTQIVEGLELFSEAQLESLEFLAEELENIEFELYPNLESISPEQVAKDLEAYFEGGLEQAGLEGRRGRGRNGQGNVKKTTRKYPNVDHNTNEALVVRLIQSAKARPGELGRKATNLHNLMNQKDWEIKAGLHSGGLGGAGRPPDKNPHITIRVGKHQYHLGCKRSNKGQLFIVSITGGPAITGGSGR